MKKPVTVQVNASGKALGVTLIQDDDPVIFASKALTPIEPCYANNKWELLTCVLVQDVSGPRGGAQRAGNFLPLFQISRFFQESPTMLSIESVLTLLLIKQDSSL